MFPYRYGTELLEIIELLAQYKNIPKIILEDQSSVKFGNYDLDLATLLILTKGKSWYNSMGYFQSNFENEKREWELIRKRSLEDVFTYILTLEYDLIDSKNKGWFDDALIIFSSIQESELNSETYRDLLVGLMEYLGSLFDINETSESFCLRLSIISKSGSYNEEESLNYFLMLSLLSYSIYSSSTY